MASIDLLKLDLKMLKELFPKEHERFQITQSSTDQLTCRFIGKNGKKCEIHATIPVILVFHCFNHFNCVWCSQLCALLTFVVGTLAIAQCLLCCNRCVYKMNWHTLVCIYEMWFIWHLQWRCVRCYSKYSQNNYDDNTKRFCRSSAFVLHRQLKQLHKQSLTKQLAHHSKSVR